MLNSAQGVSLPKPSLWPRVFPLSICVKPSPTAPPITLNPAMWLATSGNVAKSRAALVRGPVATSHAVFDGCAKRASRAATIALKSLIIGADGGGKYFVPSRPVGPE